ncbi:MAG TPA: permease-like cell division protein FtsX [Prolixibacteraceae bacterium]|nr:permease-like cell division protein FtsX [Prolixibacteraceae bacterium]HPR84870.1 permease-like cell division protein FtsX [Prolixibacteraceae bacterium]
MSGKTQPQKLNKRIFKSYLTSTISISMVLFLIGLLGVVLLNAQRLAKYVRENIGFTLVLKEDVQQSDIDNLLASLKTANFVKEAEFIDKEVAAERLKKDLGEDFSGFLGYNPLLSSVDVKLKADYANPGQLDLIEKKLTEFPQIKEVSYQRDMVKIINENVSKIGFILFFFSVLLLVIFFTLINNTIRISIYSQRFIINTMLLVGATDRFIRAPFVKQSVKYGLIGAMAANVLLFVLMMSYAKEFTGIISLDDFSIFGIVFFTVIVLGVFISWASTHMAVNRFIHLKFDELFY